MTGETGTGDARTGDATTGGATTGETRTAEQLLARVRKAFESVFMGDVEFAPSLVRVDEAGWSSLKHVEFIIALENEFGVRFDGADATDMTSISAVLERVEQRSGQAA